MARMATRLTTHLRLLAMGAISIAAAGCQIIDQYTTNATTVTVGQFNDTQPRPDIGPVVEVPPEMVGPPSVMKSSASIREQSGTTITASRETMKTDVPGAGAVTMPVGPDKISASVEVGRAWPLSTRMRLADGTRYSRSSRSSATTTILLPTCSTEPLSRATTGASPSASASTWFISTQSPTLIVGS